MRGVGFLVLICGCRGILGIEDVSLPDIPPGDGSLDDSNADQDAPTDAANPGQLCLGMHAVRVCVDSQSATFTLPSAIDTTVTASCTLVQPQAGSPNLCVIVAKNITSTVGITTRVTGSRPLVLLATDTISIGGTIDVASHRNVPNGNGAGADTGPCNAAPNGANAGGSQGGGGGAGGSLGSTGGSGGGGGGGTSGGSSTPIPTTAILRGGCRGGKGGQLGGATAGVPGSGGGAIYLLAATRIDVTGTINASGAAGGGSDSHCGGSGGGSGGIIGLEAPTLQLTGALYAIGGGGSSGGGMSTAGAAGAEATGAMATATTPGTTGAGAGGAGQPGVGSAGGSTNTLGAGGGGGGGGGGRIWMSPITAGATTAPAPTAPP